MNAYHSTVTCPTCASDLDLVQEDAMATPARRVDILRCRNRVCRATWAYVRELALVARNNGCGTQAGYQTHRRNGEAPCDQCRAAWNAEARYRRSRVNEPAA